MLSVRVLSGSGREGDTRQNTNDDARGESYEKRIFGIMSAIVIAAAWLFQQEEQQGVFINRV